MTTYTSSGTSKPTDRTGNKRSPILNLCMTPTEQYHFRLPIGVSLRRRCATRHVLGRADFLSFAHSNLRCCCLRSATRGAQGKFLPPSSLLCRFVSYKLARGAKRGPLSGARSSPWWLRDSSKSLVYYQRQRPQQWQQPPQPPHPPQPLQPHLQARKPHLQPRHPHLQPQATCSNPTRDVEVFSLSKT